MSDFNLPRPERFGLIAGEGDYPVILAREAIKSGSEVIGIGFEGITFPELADIIPNFIWVPFGKIEPIIRGFVDNQINQAIFSGRIKQSVIFESKNFDPIITNTLEKLPNQQADSLIGAAANAFGVFGVSFLDARTFMDEHLAVLGNMSGINPDEKQLRDIEYGYQIAKHIAAEDIGQSVLVKNRAVLAVEAIEGTDKAIERALEYAQDGITLVKVAKPNQDYRYDIPVIGKGTIKKFKSINRGVIAVEAKNTLMLNRDDVAAMARDFGICLVGVEPK